MSCILRVCGAELDVDALIKAVNVKPDRLWHQGEPRRARKPNGERHKHSGATFVVSDAALDDLPAQLDDETNFLEENRVQIAAMASFAGVEFATLDFGIALRDVLSHSDILTPRFLKAVAVTGLAVELSHYQCSAEDKKPSE